MYTEIFAGVKALRECDEHTLLMPSSPKRRRSDHQGCLIMYFATLEMPEILGYGT